MYLPAAFCERRFEVLRDFVRAHPLGALVAMTADGLSADHLPMLLDGQEGRCRLRGHLARANNLWQRLTGDAPVLVVFSGAQHYISPNAYPSKRASGEVVPTWNYSVVHARGRIRWLHDIDWLRSLVTDLTDEHERGQNEPWRITDAPVPYLTTMLQRIIGFEIEVDSLLGKFKASQNRAEPDRAGVREALAADGVCGQALAELVRSD